MITNFEALPQLRASYTGRIAYCSGCFDILHEGHLEGLELARSLGDLLVVGIQSDRRVQEMKGPTRPIRSEAGRMALVNGLQCVDYAFFMPPRQPEITPTMRVLRALRPDVFMCHEDNARPWGEVDVAKLRDMGTEFFVDRSAKIESTSKIIQKILMTRGLEQG